MSILRKFNDWLEKRNSERYHQYLNSTIEKCYGSREKVTEEAQKIIDLTGLSVSTENMAGFLMYAVVFLKGNKTFADVKEGFKKLMPNVDETRMALLYDYVRLKFIERKELEAIACLPQIAYYQDKKYQVALYTTTNDEDLRRYERKLPTALNAAGYYIQEGLKHELGVESLSLPEFSWIQSVLLKPAFQHLCFRYKNQVFSILIALGKNNEAFVSKQDIDNQLRECRENNMVSCVIPLDCDDFHPLSDGSYLRYSDKNVRVNVKLLSSDTPVEMSEWEIQDLGIQIVREDIEMDGGKIAHYCNVLGIEPQIFFEDKDGHRCYAVAATHAKNKSYKKKLNIQMYEWLKEYDGFYAEVGLGTSDDENGTLYRGQGLFVDYKGLEYIERAAMHTGSEDKEIYIVCENPPVIPSSSLLPTKEQINKQLLLTGHFILSHEKENNFVFQNGKLMPTDKGFIGITLGSVYSWIRSLCKRNVEFLNSIISKYSRHEEVDEDAEYMEAFLRFHFNQENIKHKELKLYYHQAQAIVAFIDAMTAHAKYIAEVVADISSYSQSLAPTTELKTAEDLAETDIVQIIARDIKEGLFT